MTAAGNSTAQNNQKSCSRFHVEVCVTPDQKHCDFGDLDPLSTSYSNEQKDPISELLSSPIQSCSLKSSSKTELFSTPEKKHVPLSKTISISRSTPHLSITGFDADQNRNGRFTITHERRKIELTVEPVVLKPQNNSFHNIINSVQNEGNLIDFKRPSNSGYSGKFSVDVTLDNSSQNSNVESTLEPISSNEDLLIF